MFDLSSSTIELNEESLYFSFDLNILSLALGLPQTGIARHFINLNTVERLKKIR